MNRVSRLTTETPLRPYKDHTIDELFEDILPNATDAQGLLDFAVGIYQEGAETITVSAAMAYIAAINERLKNVSDGLPLMIRELKHREKEGQR